MADPDPGVPAELRAIPRRDRAAHKGDFGRVLVIGGSLGMHGAPVLAAAAALRSGAGLVTVALPRSLYEVAGAAEPRAMWLPLPDAPPGVLDPAALPALLAACARADVVAIGPGLSTALSVRALLHELVPRIEAPLVLDADGLNAFAGEPARIGGRRRTTVLTPHPGELKRLTGRAPEAGDEARRIAAVDLAMRAAAITVLKGHRTVVTDGLESHFNPTGNPGMASAGAGDVLTGCIAALLAVVRPPLLAARVATFAHGRAGDLAAAELGEIGVTATDLVEKLPAALASCVA